MTRGSDAHPETRAIAVKSLDLDPQNPRLVVEGKATQSRLLAQLYEEEALDELVHSFLENGFFAEEPLVVVPNGTRFTVVEGNRRLATLKLLLDSSLRRTIGVGGWPTPSTSQANRLRRVPCVIYKERRAVLPFLGFRHITGAKKWAPFQRARFVAQMLDADQSLAEIEESLGDESQTIKKLYQDYLVYTQLVDELGFTPGTLRARFSLLEVMLGQQSIKKHIGLPHRLPTTATDSLVDERHLNELREVALWVFGDGEAAPLIAESRDINKKLAPIIADDSALSELRLTGDIDNAFDRLGGEDRYLARRIAAAERALREVVGLLPMYSHDPTIQSAARRLLSLLHTMQSQLDEAQSLDA